MLSHARTVDDFLKTLAAEERALFRKLRALLKKAHPQVQESMKYRMPTFQVGREHIAAFNRQKHYFSLYLNPDAIDPYRRKLEAAGLDCGKSCLRFRKPADLPLPLVEKIIKEAARLAAETREP